MEVVIVDDATVGAGMAADTIAALVRDRPDTVLGLATGTTPVPVCEAHIAAYRAGLRFSDVRAFVLDEYAGLPGSDPASYCSVLREEFTDRVGLPTGQSHTPDAPSCDDLPGACRARGSCRRRGGGSTPATGRLLPACVRQQTTMAGLVN